MCLKVTVKQRLIVFHNPGEWSNIYSRILQEYGMGMSVRPRLRRELGFVYRYHLGLVQHKTEPKMYYENQIHLDFYSDAAQSWFSLKYL